MTVGLAAEILLGHEILGTYRLEEVLGKGGMSVVYRGRHLLTDQEVAIKVLPPQLAEQQEVKARFIEEARTLARLEHPNIVSLYNFLEDAGHMYLVMQYADGETFNTLIEREGKVPLGDCLAIGIETLRALEYAHAQDVIHRDIKPSNILLRSDGVVKVMDFGIAKIVGSTKLTQTGQTMGTVRYMSPEQVRGKPVDARTDLYSLAVSVYEGCVGETPFDGETHFEIMRKQVSDAPPPPSSRADLPNQLDEILLRALEKDPDARYESAKDFRRALQGLASQGFPRSMTGRMAQVSQAVSPAGSRSPAKSSKRRGRGSLQLAIAGVCLLVSIGAAAWALFSDDSPRSSEKPTKGTGSKAAGGRELHAVARKLKWAVDQTYRDIELRILASKPLDAKKLAELYRDARPAYRQFVKNKGIKAKVKIRPLTIAIVPQAVLNSAEFWTEWQPDRDYHSRYMPLAATLYVHDTPGFEGKELPYGLAKHFCSLVSELSNDRCLELAEGFERYFHKAK